MRTDVSDSLYAGIAADAEALGVTIKQLISDLLVEGMGRARARRYAPYQLPEGYGWDAFGKPYTAKTPTQEGAATVTPIRKARRSAR